MCLSGLEKYYTSHTVQSSTLPLSLACLHNTGAQSLGLTELQLHCVKYVNAAKVTEEQAEAIEVRTRLQHKSPQWYVWRAGRITASMMHAVFATTVEKPAITVVNRVCYPVNSVYNVQTTWGLEHEQDARHAYTQKMSVCHKNLQVCMCGFLVNTAYPEVGASPDGLTTCECCGKGCLEIKCPFKYRSDSFQHWMRMTKTSASSWQQMDLTWRRHTTFTHKCKHRSLWPTQSTVTSWYGHKKTWQLYASSLMCTSGNRV